VAPPTPGGQGMTFSRRSYRDIFTLHRQRAKSACGCYIKVSSPSCNVKVSPPWGDSR
jgi:hypothetical protein